MSPGTYNLIDLPWLPRAAGDFRAQLSAVVADAEADWGPRLRYLATSALGLNHAMALSRAMHELAGTRPSRALTPFRLGLVGNGTMDFVKPMLEVAALRHGLALELCAADLGQGMQQALDPDQRQHQVVAR